MSDYEIDANDIGNMAIPEIPLEQQKTVVAEIESRIANGEDEETVVKEVFARLNATKH